MSVIHKSICTIVVPVIAIVCSMQVIADNKQLEALLKMDIAELMELPVFMPSRKLERQFDASSAIYVITEEDIRRSGLTKIPELLRMVPGLHVGKIDNNTWAVSSRNNMSRLSNTMLVLLDGRTLYNPLFGGVYWDVQDTFIEDIERIEIIRGPGGSLWGANAVDGIINIITKSAQKTAYTTVTAGIGEGSIKHDAGIRYGSENSPTLYSRIYAKNNKSDQGEYLDSQKSTNAGFRNEGDDAFDDGENTQAGFRMDWELDKTSSLSLQGDTYDGEFNNIRISMGSPSENTIKAKGHNLIVKWHNQISNNSDTTLQFYTDFTKREDVIIVDKREIYDLDFQHSLTLQSSILTWGLGIRYTEDDTVRGTIEFDPAKLTSKILSAFIQNKIEITANKIYLTFGTKVEENEYTGGEIQPTIRLLWKINPQETFWSSVTRAVRTPTRFDLHAQIYTGGPPVIIGDPNTEAESVVATEVGYRSQAYDHTLLDITAFNHNYSDPNQDTEMLDQTYGIEAVINHEVNKDWRIETSYTWHKGTVLVNGDEASNRRIPRNTINIRSLFDISKHWEFDTYLFYTEGMEINTSRFEDYIRADIRVGWNPKRNVRTSFTVTNLFDDKHAESNDSLRVNTAVGRGIFLSGSFDFQ